MRLGLEAGGDTLELAVELGIRGVPVDGGSLVNDGVDAALAPLRSRGLEVCQIGAFGYNPLSSDVDAAKQQAELLRCIIPLAGETGCRNVVIGPGNYHPSGFGHYDLRNFEPQAVHAFADAIAPLVALAEEHGVCLSIEMYLKGVIHSVSQFKALRRLVGCDALRANVDPSSLYTFWHAVHPARAVEDVCTGLAGHYGLVHVKEVAVSEGFHVHMGLVPLGMGHTDWAQMLRLVSPHMPEDSWLILEHVLSPEEGRQSYRVLMDAAGKARVTLS